MRFVVLPVRTFPSSPVPETSYLVTDNWDDWFRYETQYQLYVTDRNGITHNIGSTKIGQVPWPEDSRKPALPSSFEELGNGFFSLGQDVSYYEALYSQLSYTDRMAVLRGLRDVANDLTLFARVSREDVTTVSLTRSVSPSTVRGQFNRVLSGGANLSRYKFKFTALTGDEGHQVQLEMPFSVIPNSNPPTNIHVVIGRNGVGKTRLLNTFRDSVIANQVRAAEARITEGDSARAALFANVVSVSFSAFDKFQPTSQKFYEADSVKYNYVGLRRLDKRTEEYVTRTPEQLATEFGNSVTICLQGARLGRWRRALEMLEADPIFADAAITDLADTEDAAGVDLQSQAVELFKERLSSGHKIVLLTITKLVELVEEQTLVLLDEPEAHLHPPLLSAFIRALSDLLRNRNGVAVTATHSPVVLQEVPSSCVWKLRRSGRRWAVDRPQIETFGENVGILTQEIFGLEVTESGFHRLLRAAVDSGMSVEEIFEHFDDEIGGEGRSIVRALVAVRDRAAT